MFRFFKKISSRRDSLVTKAAWLAAMGIAAGCGVGSVDYGSNGEAPTWQQFLNSTYKEPGQSGVYIVNGDEPVADEKELRQFYDAVYGGGSALIVHQVGGVDAKWNAEERKALTYCVSDEFAEFKDLVIAAMDEATAGWEQVSDVDFTYVAAEDANCDLNNNNVLFDVSRISGAPYLARAFFPGDNRDVRNVVIDDSSFGNLGEITLAGILRHELGHALGFRHEHTRPEAGGVCFEDNNWRELTAYDQLSVMHYPQCNGVAGRDLAITPDDAAGAAALYGAEADPNDPTPEPEPVPEGSKQSGQAEGTLAQGEQASFEPLAVAPGSIIVVQLAGTGDADLYVRFNEDPTVFDFDCRPFLASSNERCALDVPADATTAHIMIDGYTQTSYQVAASWVSP